MAESDYFGRVHGYGINTIEKAGMKCTPAKNVDAPVIEGYPMVLECKVTNISDQDIDGFRVFGKIVNVMADESVLTDGKIDVAKLRPIIYDTVSKKYHAFGTEVRLAFGLEAARAVLGHTGGGCITDVYTFDAVEEEMIKAASPAVEALG
jgi:hypothetical protein